MALNLKEDGDQITVTDAELIPEGDPEVTYVINHLTVARHKTIVKAHQRMNPRTHQKEPNWDAIPDALFDYVLANWSGVYAKGQPLEVDALVADGQGGQQKAKFLLDGPRRAAILERAGMNEVLGASDARAESFRAPA